MYTCGLDIGARSTKAIVLEDSERVAGRGKGLTGYKPAESAEQAMEEALKSAGIKKDSLQAIASTGYARKVITEGTQFTTIGAHAAGAWRSFPGTKNVLVVSALTHAAIRLDENGQVHQFRMNDECSTGVGRYLERVAKTLEIPLDEIGQLALFSKDPQPVPSNCSVLAENELLNLISREVKPADILRGIYDALAERLVGLLKQVWDENSGVTLTGGVARNPGMIKAIEDIMGVNLNVDHDAEFAGAIGAAILAGKTEKKETEEVAA
ncbi:MAG TPA: acyl-CoA dehydratase activase [bacterium]|jgi:predicted CoA-substrate-specific enzyme activase